MKDFTFMCTLSRSLFVLFLLAIVFSMLLRLTDYDYPFDIFKLFFHTFVTHLYLLFVYTYNLSQITRCANKPQLS